MRFFSFATRMRHQFDDVIKWTNMLHVKPCRGRKLDIEGPYTGLPEELYPKVVECAFYHCGYQEATKLYEV